MARRPRELVSEEAPVRPETYLGWMRLNLAELVRYYEDLGAKRTDIARDADLSGYQALNNMIDGTYAGTRVDHVLKAFVNLGRTPAQAFLAPEEFRASLVKEPPHPLQPESRLLRIVSSRSSGDSEEGGTNMGGTRTYHILRRDLRRRAAA